MLHHCPKCKSGILRVRALVDSDDRIQSTYYFCDGCGWDQRDGNPMSVGESVAAELFRFASKL